MRKLVHIDVENLYKEPPHVLFLTVSLEEIVSLIEDFLDKAQKDENYTSVVSSFFVNTMSIMISRFINRGMPINYFEEFLDESLVAVKQIINDQFKYV